MNKLLTKIAKVVLGLSLAAGVGVAIGAKKADAVFADDPTVTFTMKGFGGQSANSYQNSAVSGTGTKSVGGTLAASSYAYNASTGQVRGNKTSIAAASPSSDNSKNWHLFNTAAMPGAIKSIVVKTSSPTSSNYFKGTLYVALGTSSMGATTSVSGASSATPTASGSYADTFTFSNLNSTNDYTYFKVMSNVAFTAGSVTNVSVVVTYDGGSSNTLNAPVPVFDRANNTITWTNVTNATSYQLKLDNGSYATATSGYSVASVSLNDVHTVSVKALADGYTTSDAGSVTFHRYATKGTSTDPYTVADAIRAIDNNDGIENVYAQGVVSAIPTAYNSQYSNITFNIVDTYGDTDFVQAYRCTGTDAADVAVGDTALVSGTLKKFNSTYEFDSGCVLQQLTHPVVSTTWTITFDSDGGTDPDDIEVGDGLTFNFPSPGTKANYVFTGWSNDSGATFHQEGETSGLVDDDDMYVAFWQTKGTQNNPYTIAEARTAITNNAGVKGVYAEGIVSAIPTAYSSQYSNITFNLVDSSNDTDFLQAYRCTGTDAADVAVGDTALVSGNLILHSGTYEFASGCVLVTLTAPTVSSLEITGSLTNTSYYTDGAWDPTGLTVTATYSNSSTADVTSNVSWSYSPATPAAMGVGANQDLTITAEFGGESDDIVKQVSVSSAPTFTLVTDPSTLTSGTTFIFVAQSTSLKAMKQGRTTSNSASQVADVTLSNSFNSGSVATSAEATVFTLGGSTGAWTIKNGDNQLGFSGTSNNNMKFNENMTDTFKINIQSGYLLSVESNTYSGRKLQYNHNNGDPRFSNYNGGQTYVYMFAMIAEVSFGDTDHISIASLPETEFAVGDTFNSTGLSILAWDGNNEATANSKTVDVTSVSLSGTTFTDSDIGSNSVTVTYTESGNNFTTSYNIYVYASATYELVTEEPEGGWSGSYLITYTVSSATTAIPETGTYAMRASLTNFDVVGNFVKVTPVTAGGKTTITAGQHLQFSIASYSTGYSIAGHSGKFVGWGSASNNGLTTSDSALLNSISYDTAEDATSILCSAGTKGLTLNTSSGQFRYYSNAFVQLYKLVESSEANAYAAEFLELMSTGANPACVADGSSDIEDLKVAWAILFADFNDLSNADKQLFTQGSADESGDDIAKTLALYDYVCGKYGTNLESQDCNNYNFMSRSVTPIGGQNLLLNTVIGNNANTITVIVIISLVSVTAIGGYFFIKRRQEN